MSSLELACPQWPNQGHGLPYAPFEKRGHITLPRKRTPGGSCRKVSAPFVPHKTSPIGCSLGDLQPVSIQLVEGPGLLALFQSLLTRYH
ncbi:hypothetical protein M1O16_05150, partial [Dehalococcoidia bacterium]|nr:hypothetical protein [Dehalococcoidia bacterium]